jgi:stress-induced morphogen
MRTGRGGEAASGGLGRVEALLREAFDPQSLRIEDESHRHRGHPGAASGGSHLRVVLVSSRFEGRSRIERHRMVYEALGPLMGTDIHALALETLAPSEERG